MTQHHTDLLSEIQAFIEREGISETTFGRKAMGDPHFVRDIRERGRQLLPKTVQKARDFMAATSAPAEAATS